MQPPHFTNSSIRVEITGWRPGLMKVSHTEALQQYAGLSLAQAKAATDAVLVGSPVVIDLQSPDVAKTLVAQLQELGAIARIRGDADNGD